MFRPLVAAEGARNVRLLYLLAGLTTVSQGAFELTYPLDLHRKGVALTPIGGAVAAIAVGQLLARVPGGAWYRGRVARRLNAGGQLLLGLSTIGMAVAGAFWLESSLGVVHGVAFGLVTTWQLAMLIESRTTVSRAGPMLAWYTAFVSLGYSIGYASDGYLIAWFGHAWAMGLAGAVALLAAVLNRALRPLGAAEAETPAAAPAAPAERLSARRALAAFRLPAAVWMASLLVLYINFMSDAVGTFFPIYGLAIGLSVGVIGVLRSLNSLSASVIRFVAAGILRFTPPSGLNHVAVVAMAAASLALAGFRQPWLLGAAFIVLGLSRGLIRVTSATAVAEQRERLGPQLGLASGVYNAGLDLGSLLAPPLTGVLATGFGIPTAFRSVAVGLLLAYYGLWLLIRVARRPAPSSTPTPEPAVPAGGARS